MLLSFTEMCFSSLVPLGTEVCAHTAGVWWCLVWKGLPAVYRSSVFPLCGPVMHWSRFWNTRRYGLRSCSISYLLTVETPLKHRLELGVNKGNQQMRMCGFSLRIKSDAVPMFVHAMQIVTGACESLCIWIDAPALALHLHLQWWAAITCQPINKCTMQTCEMGKEMMSNLETHIETVKALVWFFTSKPVKNIAIKVKKTRHKMTRAGWQLGVTVCLTCEAPSLTPVLGSGERSSMLEAPWPEAKNAAFSAVEKLQSSRPTDSIEELPSKERAFQYPSFEHIL